MMPNHHYMFIVIQLLIYVKVFEHTIFLKYYVSIKYKYLFFNSNNKIFKVVKKRDAEIIPHLLNKFSATARMINFYFQN